MPTYTANGRIISDGAAFSLVHEGVTMHFPATWLATATQAEKDRYGVNLYTTSTATPVPFSVSPRQIRQALTQVGLRDAVEAAVAAGNRDTKDWWEFSTDVERHHPKVIAMADALGVTKEQLDNLFILAETL